jgi:hypothetical protein
MKQLLIIIAFFTVLPGFGQDTLEEDTLYVKFDSLSKKLDKAMISLRRSNIRLRYYSTVQKAVAGDSVSSMVRSGVFEQADTPDLLRLIELVNNIVESEMAWANVLQYQIDQIMEERSRLLKLLKIKYGEEIQTKDIGIRMRIPIFYCFKSETIHPSCVKLY